MTLRLVVSSRHVICSELRCIDKLISASEGPKVFGLCTFELLFRVGMPLGMPLSPADGHGWGHGYPFACQLISASVLHVL